MSDADKASWILAKCKRLENGCLELQMPRKESGHVQMAHLGRRVYAHRFMYEFTKGVTVPKDRCVCHSCDNPACMNVEHLWVGTWGDNLRDMARKGRHQEQKKTHCPRGHAYEGENLRFQPNGARICVTCTRARYRLRLGWTEEEAYSLPVTPANAVTKRRWPKPATQGL